MLCFNLLMGKPHPETVCGGLVTVNIVACYGDALLERQTNPPASEPHLSTQRLWIHKGCDCQASVQLEYKGNNI